jgi:hypothetical protein
VNLSDTLLGPVYSLGSLSFNHNLTDHPPNLMDPLLNYNVFCLSLDRQGLVLMDPPLVRSDIPPDN